MATSSLKNTEICSMHLKRNSFMHAFSSCFLSNLLSAWESWGVLGLEWCSKHFREKWYLYDYYISCNAAPANLRLFSLGLSEAH